MPTDVALLAGVPFFKYLDHDEREILARQLDAVEIPAGQLVFQINDPGGTMFVIRKGTVEVFCNDNTGERIVLETAGPGDVFGELSFLDGGARSASVLVVQDLEALAVDRDDLDHLFRIHPEAGLDIIAAMGNRLRRTVQLLRSTASRNVNTEVQDRRSKVERMADWIAEFSGSIAFLLLHVVFFAVWILLNVHWLPGWTPPLFDPFPFGLLTMVVSLEAIILSVFVLLSQNRQVAKDRIRGDIEYEINLKAELEIAHMHEKIDRLHIETLGRLNELSTAPGNARIDDSARGLGTEFAHGSEHKEHAMPKPKNTICLWFDKDAEEAARFYAATFPNSEVIAAHKAPGDFPDGKEGDVLTVEFTVLGIPCLGLNGGPAFKHSEAFSFQIATDDQEETDRYWNAIVSNGGQESACGWCKDRWGLSWQITPRVLTEAMAAGGAEAKRAFSAMMSMKKIDVAAIEAARRG